MSLAQYVYNNAYKPFKKHVLELKTDKKPVSKIPTPQRYSNRFIMHEKLLLI